MKRTAITLPVPFVVFFGAEKRRRVAMLLALLTLAALAVSPRTATAQVISVTGVVVGMTGQNNTCALTTAGGLSCWGSHQSVGAGISGLGIAQPFGAVTNPNDVTSLTSGVVRMAFSGQHLCFIGADTEVRCRGANSTGQLGNGTVMSSLAPVLVPGLAGATAVAVGIGHSCALMATGGVKCWGINGSNQLGNVGNQNSPSPVDVTGLTSGVLAIAAGANYTCALTSANGLKCWGILQFAGGGSDFKNTPADVPGLTSGVSAVSVGTEHACAVTAAGGVKCWGGNFYGQLGNNGGTLSGGPTPVDVTGLASGISNVSAGTFSSCALTNAGGVKCWGRNTSGQLGDISTTERRTPVDVAGLASGAISVSANDQHTCVVLANNDVRCWGNNSFGQLGDGTLTNRQVPFRTTQSLSFPAITGVMFASGGSVPLVATATSVLAATFSTTSPIAVCEVIAQRMYTYGTGTCTVIASQVGTGTIGAATPVSQDIDIAPATQVITFPALPDKVLGSNNTITMSATIFSGLPISFTSLTPAVCSTNGVTSMSYTTPGCSVGNPLGCAISNSNGTALTTGTCTIRASQAGNANYAPAPDVDRSFLVSDLAFVAVQSRKTHGAAGTFDIAIDTAQVISGPVTVEPRNSGGGHTIVFQFSGTVTAPGTVSVTPLGSATATFSGNEVLVALANVPDNRRVTVTLVNVNGAVSPPPASIGFLTGDVNNSRAVNASDISGTKARSGQATTALNFRFDVNANGAINASDISAVKARSGLTLP